MQLSDIVKSTELMTDEELRERLTEIRNHRLQAPEKVKKAERKKSKDKKSSVDKLMAGMSKEEIQALLDRYK